MIAFALIGPGTLQLVLVICTFSINGVAFSVAFAGASDFLPQRQRAAFFGCVIAFYSIAARDALSSPRDLEAGSVSIGTMPEMSSDAVASWIT